MSRGQGSAEPRRVDLRLAAAVLPGWLAAAVALLTPTLVAGAMLGGFCALGAAVAVGSMIDRRAVRFGARGRGAAAARLALVVAAGAVAVLAPMLPRLHAARSSPLAEAARQGSAVHLTATLADDPRALASSGAGPPRIAVTARVDGGCVGDGHRCAAGAPPLRGTVLVLAPAEGWASLLPGQRIAVSGIAAAPRPGDLLAAAVYVDDPPALIGRPPPWQRGAGRLRESLRAAVAGLDPGPRGLLPGLVVGDTSRMDPVLAQRFDQAGMSHLLAVSGTNCSILIGAIVLALRRAAVRPRTVAAVALLALIGFVILARPTPSVVRAAAMAAVALVALALGRERTAVPVLSSAVLALLIWAPQWALDAGFAMSVAATASLVLIAPRWAQALRDRRAPPILAEAGAVAAAASVATLPIIVAIGGPLSAVTVPANMLAEPGVPIATVLGLLVVLVAPLHLGAAQALAGVAALPCRWLIAVADRFGGLEGSALPWPAGAVGAVLLIALIGLLVAAVRRGLGPVLMAAVAAAAVVQFPIRATSGAWPPETWSMVACDVGQGDALVLRTGPGAAVVVDTGPEPLAVDGCLRRLGVTDVPLLVLTHLHADHVGGIVGVLHGRQVGQIVTGPLLEPAAGRDAVVAALASVGRPAGDLAPAAAGTTARVGDLGLEFLWPRRALRGTHSDPNNSSLIIRATIDGMTVLLTGDSEMEQQQAMLDAGLDLRADVLKVPHHGSRFGSERFLAAVRARVAVISVGQPNDFGHPAPALLGAVQRVGIATVLRTDQSGDLALTGEPGGGIRVQVRGRTAAAAAATDRWPADPARLEQRPGRRSRGSRPRPPGAAPSPARGRPWTVAPWSAAPRGCPPRRQPGPARARPTAGRRARAP